MLRYLRFYINPLAVSAIAVGILFGGIWLWLPGLLYVGGIALLDHLLPHDFDEQPYRFPFLLDLALYLSLPTVLLLFVTLMWTAGSGSTDALGLGALVREHWGIDILAARNTTPWYDYVLMWPALLVPGTAAGGLAGHELTHRTASPFDLWLGRTAMSVLWGIAFPIEHVYGHHAYVSTPKDPATAARGDSLYQHLPKSLYRTVVNAWEIEAARLDKIGAPFLSPRNVLLRMGLIALAFSAAAFYLAGWMGLLFHLLLCINAKVALEALNFIEHYGLVRQPDQPVQPRHSWNCNHTVSGIFTYNLTRHSHHHANAQVHYQDLKAFSEQPEMPGGFMTAYVSSYIPWWWRRKIAPKLLVWDREQAEQREYPLIRAANQASGWPELSASAANP